MTRHTMPAVATRRARRTRALSVLAALAVLTVSWAQAPVAHAATETITVDFALEAGSAPSPVDLQLDGTLACTDWTTTTVSTPITLVLQAGHTTTSPVALSAPDGLDCQVTLGATAPSRYTWAVEPNSPAWEILSVSTPVTVHFTGSLQGNRPTNGVFACTWMDPDPTTPHPFGGSMSIGAGTFVSALFDNGLTTKVVAGQGSWSLQYTPDPSLPGGADGLLPVTFTPLAGFWGTVTDQYVTITNSLGLTGTNRYCVYMNRPTAPQANPASVTTDIDTPVSTPLAVYRGSGDPTSVLFDNGATTKTVPGQGTWSIAVVTSPNFEAIVTFTPAPGYRGAVTPQTYTVNDDKLMTASSTISVRIRNPPQPSPASAAVNPNATATLTATVTPGDGALMGAYFDNLLDTKTVAGEGTWTIGLVANTVTETFTPEPGFTGPVTTQVYTVNDMVALRGTSTLSVTVNQAPTASSASGQGTSGGVVTLTATVTAGTGSLAAVALDNGSATKAVAGEGTWTVSLSGSTVTAAFTPEAGFVGTATAQTYIVTDSVGLTGSGTLSATVSAVVITAPATTTAATTTAAGATASLASTGSDVSAPGLAGAVVCVVVGAAILLRRRPTSRRTTR